ncbi:hypothetical protein TNCV_623561 [Trichonephila clavipes]|nr:hypothetical protein TNCV_623561 [Trichonephila clavipes]
MSYDYTACKRSLECLFGLGALGKIESYYRFASLELRCLPLGGKLCVKITCGDWYPPVLYCTKKRSLRQEYCEDDALLILPAGLGPVKSRQDDLKNRKICHETKRINFKKYFFRTSDCIENDTTMEDDSFRQESPVNTSKEPFFFPEFDLNKFSSFKSFLDCFDQQCLEYQKDEQWKKQNIP